MHLHATITTVFDYAMASRFVLVKVFTINDTRLQQVDFFLIKQHDPAHNACSLRVNHPRRASSDNDY